MNLLSAQDVAVVGLTSSATHEKEGHDADDYVFAHHSILQYYIITIFHLIIRMTKYSYFITSLRYGLPIIAIILYAFLQNL